METLDSKQKATLQEYQSVVNANDINASIQILNDCKWNLQNAINTAFELQGAPSKGPSSAPLQASSQPATSSSTVNTGGSGNQGGGFRGSNPPPGNPEQWAPINTLLASGLSFMGPIAHRVLPHWAAESQNVAPPAFARKLKDKYPDLPNFYEGTYRDACRQARSQNRSLFVYIHSPQHEDTEEFISQSLTNELVRQTLDNNFVCWAGSVTQTDAYKLCQKLRVEGYPCVAMVNPYREGSRIPVPIHEGLFPPEQMVNWLHEVKVKYEADLAEAKRRNVEVKQNTQLREIQDMEYVQALELDRKREEEERQKKELEKIAAMEEEEKKLEEKKKREQEKKEREEREKLRLERRKKAMEDEPNPGPGVVQVAIRLPDGQQIKRRFREEDKFEVLFNIIETYDLRTPHGDKIEKWVMRSRYPRKKWDDPDMLLKDAKMGRSALFFVQEDM
eukprot:CAMPEP_0114527770 /NCGR_PEP_ID=MMETSP0109-20121206/23809_1 /TAXON_ID=29199 /ORGANISM="Chlorarachnion reptans, Strain CCCM449" /LENGTH=446 /DNA_ID=CAMNT_0001709789 /DNA_START=177 /DNA_END=1517 /DNA_ORIENTATION=-